MLPQDGTAGTLVGRAETPAGPAIVRIDADGVHDITASAVTARAFLAHGTLAHAFCYTSTGGFHETRRRRQKHGNAGLAYRAFNDIAARADVPGMSSGAAVLPRMAG